MRNGWHNGWTVRKFACNSASVHAHCKPYAFKSVARSEQGGKLSALKEEQEKPEVWQDLERSQKLAREIAAIEGKLHAYEKSRKAIDEVSALIDLIEEMGGDEEELSAEIQELDGLIATAETDIEDMRIRALLTLHSGAGGTESCDWVSMLYRMYTRYAEKSGFKVTELDRLDGDEAGIKSVDFKIEGENAYGYLKAEKGVHRLVRISPFDANKRRHTSFASLEVMPEIEDDGDVEIRSEDLKVTTYRSSGAGGQHINKTESAIRIQHIPTGIVVSCQNERSQIQNREMAMKMLRSKLIELKESERLEKEQNIKGEIKKIEWGSQIRSYVFCPYTLVKDHRTGCETGNIQAVMDGDIQPFIIDYLKKS